MATGLTSRSLQIAGRFHLPCSAESYSCCLRVQFVSGNRSSVPWQKRLHCFTYYITWLVKTQKSATKCRFIKAYHWWYRIETDQSYKFGCVGEARQTKTLIPPKIPCWKSVFLNFLNFFFKKWGDPAPTQPPPPSPSHCAGPECRLQPLGQAWPYRS